MHKIFRLPQMRYNLKSKFSYILIKLKFSDTMPFMYFNFFQVYFIFVEKNYLHVV